MLTCSLSQLIYSFVRGRVWSNCQETLKRGEGKQGLPICLDDLPKNLSYVYIFCILISLWVHDLHEIVVDFRLHVSHCFHTNHQKTVFKIVKRVSIFVKIISFYITAKILCFVAHCFTSSSESSIKKILNIIFTSSFN